MTEFVCAGCGRTGRRGNGVRWYEGSVRDVDLDPDETAIENGEFLCEDCFRRLDPEDQPRWRPLA